MTLSHALDNAPPLDEFGIVEHVMATQKPFGDDFYILDQLQHALCLRLDQIAPQVPAAGELLAAVAHSGERSLHRLFAEPTLRTAIVHAHEQVVSDVRYGLTENDRGHRLTDCAAMFHAAAEYVRGGGVDTPLQDGSLAPVGPEPHLGWLWQDEHPNDMFGAAFRKVIMEQYHALPYTPGPIALETLTAGCRLLHELLPTLAPSALRHAQIIAITPSVGRLANVASSSHFFIGGVIFISDKLFSPWWVAEHLLHESLHQKLYDFRHGHSLMQLDDVIDNETPVPSLWNASRLTGANRWRTERVFAAFHVYVHLALLATVAEQRAPELESRYGPIADVLDSRSVRARARYLGLQLRTAFGQNLGAAGHAMVDWLHSLLDILDPTPPPSDATLHLRLELYRRETDQIERRLAAAPHRDEAGLAELAREDIAGTRDILTDLGAHTPLEPLDTFTAGLTESELAQSYPAIRRIINDSLIDATVDGYRLDGSGRHDRRAGEMIARSSDMFLALRTGIPRPVAEAKRRAVAGFFAGSCTDEVGRFLAAIAASLPPAARILEIGTGFGVGTAWIVSGLGDRTDVDVLSIEIDEQRAEAARAYDWPPYVRLGAADAETAVRMSDVFDLVFADALPYKYHHISAALESLRPGGMLIVDDMRGRSPRDPNLPSIQALRQELLDNPALAAVDVDWASGLVIATRRR